MSHNNSYEELFGSPISKGLGPDRRGANSSFKEFKERFEQKLGDRLLENSIDKPIGISKIQSPAKSDVSVEIQPNITVHFTKNVLNYLLGKKDWLKFSAPGVQVRDFKKLLTTMFEATFGAKFCVVLGTTDDGLTKIECFASTTPSKKIKSEVEEDPPVKICVATTKDWKQDCDAIYFILIKKVSPDMLESVSKQLEPEILKKITSQVEKAKVQEDFHHFTGKNQDLGKVFHKHVVPQNQPQSKQPKQPKEAASSPVEVHHSKQDAQNPDSATIKKKAKKKKKKNGNAAGIESKIVNAEATEVLIESGNNESAQGSKADSHVDHNKDHSEILEEQPAELPKVNAESHQKSGPSKIAALDEGAVVEERVDSSQNSKVEEEILSIPDKASPNSSAGGKKQQQPQAAPEITQNSSRPHHARHQASPSKPGPSFKHPSTSTGLQDLPKTVVSDVQNSPKEVPAPNSGPSTAGKQSIGSKKKRKQERAAREAAEKARLLEDEDVERVEEPEPPRHDKDKEKFLQKRPLEKSPSPEPAEEKPEPPKHKPSHERPIIRPAVVGRTDPLSPRKVHFQQRPEKFAQSSRMVDEIAPAAPEVLSDVETPKSNPRDAYKPKSIRTDKTDSHHGTLVESDNSFKGSQAFRDKAGKASVPVREAPYKGDYYRKGNQDRESSWKPSNRDTRGPQESRFGYNRANEPSEKFPRRDAKLPDKFRDEKPKESSRKSSTDLDTELAPITPQTERSCSVTNQYQSGAGEYQKIKYKRRHHDGSSSSEKNKSSEYSRTSNPYSAVAKQETSRPKEVKPEETRPRFNNRDQDDRSPKNYHNSDHRGRGNFHQEERRPWKDNQRGGDQHRDGPRRGSTNTDRSNSWRSGPTWRGTNQRPQGDNSDRGNQGRSNPYPPSSSNNWRNDKGYGRPDDRDRPPYESRRGSRGGRGNDDRRQGNNHSDYNDGKYNHGNRGYQRGRDSRGFRGRNDQDDPHQYRRGNGSAYFAHLDTAVVPKTKRSSDKKEPNDRR